MSAADDYPDIEKMAVLNRNADAIAALAKIDQLHGALTSLAAEYDRLAQRAYNAGAAVLEIPLLDAWTALGVTSIPAGVR